MLLWGLPFYNATYVASKGFITLSLKPLSTLDLYDNLGIKLTLGLRFFSSLRAENLGELCCRLGENQVLEFQGDMSKDSLAIGGWHSFIKVLAGAVDEGAAQISVPLFTSQASAGFPSPADDYIEAELDLNRYLIRNPPDTFMVRVTNAALAGAGILDGDILIVDRSIGPRHGMIVVAVVNGEMCVRRLNRKSGNWVLDPQNKDFQPLRIRPGQDLEIWGVVTGMVRKY